MRKLPCLLMFCLTILGPARGQKYEVSVLAGVARIGKTPLGSLSANYPVDNDTTLRNGYSYGAGLTYNTRGYYGHEVGYLYTRATFRTNNPTADDDGTKTASEGRVAIHQAFYNFLIYFMPRGERWRPYITGGVETHRYGNPRIAGVTGLTSQNYGANYGGGIKLKLFEHALVRFDLRDYITGKPYYLYYEGTTNHFGSLRQQEASFGIVIGF